MTVLYLSRHGETEFNRDGRYQGQLDSPLTTRGVDQAKAVARMLKEQLKGADLGVVASPLGRAMATARIFAEALGVTPDTDDRLREIGMGEWDGLTRAEIAERWPDARRGRSKREWMFFAPGGETLGDVTQRASAALAEYMAEEGRVFVLVSHAMTGRVIRAVHSGEDMRAALAADAPQDAAYVLGPEGAVELMPTEAYQRRMGPVTPKVSSQADTQR